VKSFVEQAIKEFYKEVKVADIYNLPYEDNEFDKVFCFEVFDFIPDYNKAMKELVRVCKGEIIIASPNIDFFVIKSFLLGRTKKLLDALVCRGVYSLNKNSYKKLAKEFNLKLKVKYYSGRYSFIRGLFGRFLSGSIIGIFKKRVGNKLR